MLVENAFGGKGKDPFWNTQAVALLGILITILKTQEKEFQNLYNVRQLLNLLGSNPEAVDGLFSRHADEVLFSEYKSFIAYDEKVVNGVIATCKAALQIFSDESVAKVTSIDSINLQDFRDKPVVLFIQNSVADQKYYSVLTSIFFEQFFSFVLGRFPKKVKNRIFFLLIDEASSLNLADTSACSSKCSRKHQCEHYTLQYRTSLKLFIIMAGMMPMPLSQTVLPKCILRGSRMRQQKNWNKRSGVLSMLMKKVKKWCVRS